MKLSKIARITRKYKALTLIGEGGRQWVHIGPAAYVLDGAPRITSGEELLESPPEDDGRPRQARLG